MTRRLLGAAAGLSLVAMVGVGCSSSGSSGTSASATTTASGGGGAAGCTNVTNGEVKVVTTNFDFSPNCITLTGGDRLKVTYDNQESGVKHNIDFKGAKSSTGKAATDLKAGPDTQTVTLVGLKPGTYTYVCDIHANMKGTLTVK